MLSEIEVRVQIWNLVKTRSLEGAANKYFAQKGYSQNDLDILRVKKRINEPKMVATCRLLSSIEERLEIKQTIHFHHLGVKSPNFK